MEDFTKHFKDRLENEGDYPPSDAAWHRVEQGLADPGGSSFLGGWRKWLALGLALLLGFGLSEAWHAGINQNNSQTAIAVDDDGGSPEKQITKQFIERVVHDTVIQYVYLDRSIEQELSQAQDALVNLQSSYDQSLAELNRFKTNQKDFLELNTAISNALGLDQTVDSVDPSYLTKKMIVQLNAYTQARESDIMEESKREESNDMYIPRLSAIPTFDLNELNLPRLITPSIGSIIDFTALQLDHNKKSLMRSLTPDYARVGINGTPTAKSIFSENDGGRSEVDFGLYTELLFSRHMSLKIGLNLRRSKAKIEDEELAFSYANPMVSDPNASFYELYIDNHYLDIPISLKYRIKDHKVIAPYGSIGMMFTKNRKQEYLFEFESQQDETYVTSEVEGGPLSLASLRMALGVDYALSRHLYGFTELAYRYNFRISESESDRVNGIGLNIGVAYEF